MHVLSRGRNEAVIINDDIIMTVLEVRGDKVRLQFDLPNQYSLHRKEVYDAIKHQGQWIETRSDRISAPQSPIEVAPNAALAIRIAAESDLASINDIYNHYVLHSTCTYQEEPEPIESRREWFGKHGQQHPVTVAELDGRVVGWGSLSAFHPRSAYRFTVENSVYVDHRFHRRGIGAAILADLIDRARPLGHRSIIALIDAEQPPSIAIHAKFGFEQVGHLKRVGYKFGRWLDVIYMQLSL